MRRLALLSGLLLAGCASFAPQPVSFPFPERPPVRFQAGEAGLEGPVCVSETDAQLLAVFFDQLNAFKHAWERRRP